MLKFCLSFALFALLPRLPESRPEKVCVYDFNNPYIPPSRQDSVAYYIKAYGLYPDWIRVFKVESGNQFNSSLGVRCYNLAGMGVASRRKTTATSTSNGYSCYCSLESFVQDMRLFQEAKPIKNGEQFEDYLRRIHYNPNPSYYEYLHSVTR